MHAPKGTQAACHARSRERRRADVFNPRSLAWVRKRTVVEECTLGAATDKASNDGFTRAFEKLVGGFDGRETQNQASDQIKAGYKELDENIDYLNFVFKKFRARK
jgi:hypothetical protein